MTAAPSILAHRDPMLDLAHAWNGDADRWPRRASVVLFTRKVAASGTSARLWL